MSEPMDSPTSCIQELTEINKEVAGFGHLWAADAGTLKEKSKLYDRLHRAALRGIGSDLTVAVKDATAHAAVEEKSPGLAEDIEALEGKVEEYKTLFKSLELRGSHAQSVLAAYRAEARTGEFVAAEPEWSGG